MEKLYEHILQKQNEELRALKEQVAALNNRLEQQCCPNAHSTAEVPCFEGPKGTTIVQTGIANTARVSTRITVNVFGRERTDHIGTQQVCQILNEAARAPELPDAAIQAILGMAALIYSDPEHPENITCYLPNKKRQEAMVYGETGWEIRPVQLVLSPMAQRSVDHLFRKQPWEGDLEACTQVLKQLQVWEDHNGRLRQPPGLATPLQAVLVRNKQHLARLLGRVGHVVTLRDLNSSEKPVDPDPNDAARPKIFSRHSATCRPGQSLPWQSSS